VRGLILNRFESAPRDRVHSGNRRRMAARELHAHQGDDSPFLSAGGDGLGHWHPVGRDDKDSHNGASSASYASTQPA